MKPPRPLLLVLLLGLALPAAGDPNHEHGGGEQPRRRAGGDNWRDRVGTKTMGGEQPDGERRERYRPGPPPTPGGCVGQQGGMTDPQFDACIDLLARQATQVSPGFMERGGGGEKIDQIHDRYHNANRPHGTTGQIPLTAEEFNTFKDEVALPYVGLRRLHWQLTRRPPQDPQELLRLRQEYEQKGRALEQKVNEFARDPNSELGEITKIAREVITPPQPTPGPKPGETLPPSGYQPPIFVGESPGYPNLTAGYDQLAAGDAGSARASASSALAADPTLTDALRLRAQAAGLMRDYAAAAADARSALEINPNDEKMQGVLAMTEGRGLAGGGGAGELAGAGQAANFAVGYRSLALPNSGDTKAGAAANSLVRQTDKHLQMKDWAAARDAASKALEIDPNNVNALFLRSVANAQSGDLQGALKDALAATALDPNNGKLHSAKATILNRLGRYGEASAAALRALELNPRDANALYALAHARAGLGDRAGVEDALKRLAGENAQYAGLYEQAIQAPEDADLLLLFKDQLAGQSGGKGGKSPFSRTGRFGSIALVSLLGGGLLGLGFLKFLLPPLRSAFTQVFTRANKRWPTVSSSAAPTLLDAPAPLSEPELLRGQFRIGPQIGAGGMGMVFKGEDVSLGRTVAIKRMRDELKLDRRERERFVSEAKLVAALKHPNIVEIYSIIEDKGDLYLVFEYVAGKTLHEVVVGKGRLSLEEALPIFSRVADALEYAHGRAIIHRDLKPSNIMIDEDGVPRVMDFGIARAAKDALTRQAMTNTVVGTPPYMAPEQEQGLVRKESDVYALAICLYEVLTGRLAFAGTGAGMLMNKINKTFAPVTTLAPELPPALDEVFAKAFEPDPNKRYSTPKQLFAALDAAAARRA